MRFTASMIVCMAGKELPPVEHPKSAMQKCLLEVGISNFVAISSSMISVAASNIPLLETKHYKNSFKRMFGSAITHPGMKFYK